MAASAWLDFPILNRSATVWNSVVSASDGDLNLVVEKKSVQNL